MATETEVLAQEQNPQANGEKTVKSIIRDLIANGAKRFNKCKIKSVKLDADWQDKNYARLSLTLFNKVPGYIAGEEEGTFIKGMTNTVFVTSYNISATLKENDEWAWLANQIVERPKALELLLPGSEIDILQTEYLAGEEVVNPFSTKENNEWPIYDHDVLVNNVIDIKLGKTGEKMAMTLANAILLG